MSRIDDLRAQYTESGAAYTMQSSAMRHQKELTLELLIEQIQTNEKLDKLIELLAPPKIEQKAEVKSSARQKVEAS